MLLHSYALLAGVWDADRVLNSSLEHMDPWSWVPSFLIEQVSGCFAQDKQENYDHFQSVTRHPYWNNRLARFETWTCCVESSFWAVRFYNWKHLENLGFVCLSTRPKLVLKGLECPLTILQLPPLLHQLVDKHFRSTQLSNLPYEKGTERAMGDYWAALWQGLPFSSSKYIFRPSLLNQ